MDKNSPVKLSAHFLIVIDPRVVGRSDHKLIDIITPYVSGCRLTGFMFGKKNINRGTG